MSSAGGTTNDRDPSTPEEMPDVDRSKPPGGFASPSAARQRQRELEDRQRRAELERRRVQRDLETRQREAGRERQKAQRELEAKQLEAQRERQRAQRALEDAQESERT